METKEIKPFGKVFTQNREYYLLEPHARAMSDGTFEILVVPYTEIYSTVYPNHGVFAGTFKLGSNYNRSIRIGGVKEIMSKRDIDDFWWKYDVPITMAVIIITVFLIIVALVEFMN
jgi:hypothetical protein